MVNGGDNITEADWSDVSGIIEQVPSYNYIPVLHISLPYHKWHSQTFRELF